MSNLCFKLTKASDRLLFCLSPSTDFSLSLTSLILTTNLNIKPEVCAWTRPLLLWSHFTKRALNGRIRAMLLKYSGVSLLKAKDKQAHAPSASSQLPLTAYWTSMENEWWESKLRHRACSQPRALKRHKYSNPAFFFSSLRTWRSLYNLFSSVVLLMYSSFILVCLTSCLNMSQFKITLPTLKVIKNKNEKQLLLTM